MGNAFQAKYGIRKVLSEMLLKLNNDQQQKEILSNPCVNYWPVIREMHFWF